MPNDNSPSVAVATVDELLVANGVLKPIKTYADYSDALKQIESLMMAESDTAEGERLDKMVTLVETYESKNHSPNGLIV